MQIEQVLKEDAKYTLLPVQELKEDENDSHLSMSPLLSPRNGRRQEHTLLAVKELKEAENDSYMSLTLSSSIK